MEGLLIFLSVHQVMKAEKLFKSKGLRVDLVPMPREISSDCGVAIELSPEVIRKAMDLLKENQLPPSSCYIRRKGMYERVDQE